MKHGFGAATNERVKSAAKREGVIAAVARLGEAADQEDRISIIAGDFNTSFQDGLAGSKWEDCKLKDFTCDASPFPADACSDGDGYDDTFAILEGPLSSSSKVAWAVLTKKLKSTYNSTEFGDAAIDHIAVPKRFEKNFSKPERFLDTFGSDTLSGLH